MRAAIYARVACANQQMKHAIVSQLETLRDYAASHGMEIIEEFADEGYSGLWLDRPGLDRMRSFAAHRGFDVLLTWGPDRLARSFALQVLIIEELVRCGVRTLFPDRGPADQPLSKLREITAAVAEIEQSKVTERDWQGNRYGWESEAAVFRKALDARSCLPARERNDSVDAASRGSGQRDFHTSINQGVE